MFSQNFVELYRAPLRYPDLPIWMGSDINLPNIDWESLTAIDSMHPIPLCKRFLSFMQYHAFSQIVKFQRKEIISWTF